MSHKNRTTTDNDNHSEESSRVKPYFSIQMMHAASLAPFLIPRLYFLTTWPYDPLTIALPSTNKFQRSSSVPCLV